MRSSLVKAGIIALALVGPWIGEASAADPLAEVALTLENGRFSPEELRVKAGSPFMLVITNKELKDEEFEIQSLKIEKVVPAGRTRRVKMPALRPGVYRFNGEYAEATANGRLVVE
jgi:cupredoxin-like protein